MAAPVAKALEADLDIVIPRKVGLPGNPELAAAAVAPDGNVIYNTLVMNTFNLRPQDIEHEIRRELAEIKRRTVAYRGQRPEPIIAGRIVIMIDDGLATGFTAEAALQYLRRAQPRRLLLAVPVAPPDTIQRLRELVDEIVCLEQPEPFYAVGQFYASFEQVQDWEVVEILQDYWSASTAKR